VTAGELQKVAPRYRRGGHQLIAMERLVDLISGALSRASDKRWQ
jgi:hypothetical protein